MNVSDFVVESFEQGIAKIRRTADNAIVPLDHSNQDYCDFLTWASQQESLDHGYSPPYLGEYFCDKDRLVKRCKDLALMLHESPGRLPDGNVNYEFSTHNAVRHGTGDFLGMMKVTSHKDKDWDDEMKLEPSRIWATEEVLASLNEDLVDEKSDARRLSSLPVERSFVYVDISDFSTYPPWHQALIIKSLILIVTDTQIYPDVAEELEASLCIGDGYIFCFTSATVATRFAAFLAANIEQAVARDEVPVEFHFRMGVHVGPVYHFWDIGREDWNYIGDGINGGNRILNAIGKGADDLVFISGEVRRELLRKQREPQGGSLLNSLANRGRREDKHGKRWRVYELNHDLFARSVGHQC